MEWRVKFDSYERQNTMPLDRAKIEALREIAEQLETLNKTLDTGIGMLIDELSEIKKQKTINHLHSNKIGTHRNCIRISTANSLEHEITKLKICYNLIKEGKEVITEAVFNNGSRADILILDDHKIIEILHSEKEIDCLKKSEKYPALFTLEMVKSGD